MGGSHLEDTASENSSQNELRRRSEELTRAANIQQEIEDSEPALLTLNASAQKLISQKGQTLYIFNGEYQKLIETINKIKINEASFTLEMYNNFFKPAFIQIYQLHDDAKHIDNEFDKLMPQIKQQADFI